MNRFLHQFWTGKQIMQVELQIQRKLTMSTLIIIRDVFIITSLTGYILRPPMLSNQTFSQDGWCKAEYIGGCSVLCRALQRWCKVGIFSIIPKHISLWSFFIYFPVGENLLTIIKLLFLFLSLSFLPALDGVCNNFLLL